jgi:hypothetical protein
MSTILTKKRCWYLRVLIMEGIFPTLLFIQNNVNTPVSYISISVIKTVLYCEVIFCNTDSFAILIYKNLVYYIQRFCQLIIYCTQFMGVTIGGVQTGEWIDHLLIYTRLGTTSNYSATANLHILLITRAHAKSSQSAFTSRFLVTDLQRGDPSASVLTSLSAG